jgi:hypothetical protein
MHIPSAMNFLKFEYLSHFIFFIPLVELTYEPLFDESFAASTPHVADSGAQAQPFRIAHSTGTEDYLNMKELFTVKKFPPQFTTTNSWNRPGR